MRFNAFSPILFTALFIFGAPSLFAQEGEKAPEETPAEGDGKTEEVTADAKKADGEKKPEEKKDADAKKDGKTADGDTPLGPGGKPLRTDYPGTEESKQARMDTDQIKGMNVDPNEPSTAYGLRIRELENKIDDLKEKVFQSKTRIVLLRETLLSGNLAGARAIVIHKTELGSAWRLGQALYSLDGTRIFSKLDKSGDLSDKRSFEIYNASVSPGTHSLSVFLKYRGSSVGIFPYFKGYDGDIKSACEFNAQEGKVAQIKVIVYPEGGVAESIEKRPNVKCEVQYFDNLREGDEIPAVDDKTGAAPKEQ